MKKDNTFKRRTQINASIEDLFQWHARPGAIERMSPPWDPLKVLHRTGGIETGATVVLKMKAGPVYYKWYAEHTEYEAPFLFRDKQIKGPFADWIHTHKFERAEDNKSILEDRIDYKLPVYPFGSLMMDSLVQKKLERIFAYRHRTIAADMTQHLSYQEQPRLKILISGPSGLIGTSLIPFLTTGGHQVIRLVRKRSQAGEDAAFWDPVVGILSSEDIEGIDAVIHLAGENIGEGRWTKNKKKRIVDSRVKSTQLIAETISGMAKKPKVFICASAIGYYGDRGDYVLNEKDEAGSDFLSEVCAKWEKAAGQAIGNNIRTVFMRIGVVLSPQGGALKKLLFPFKAGLGAKIGSGRQYMSWIGIDDVVGAIYHVLMNEHIEGPVNAVAPNPVTNEEFTKTLGNIFKRPTICSLPAPLIKAVFGEMGEEILLSSTRVKPEKLLETNYQFRYPALQDTLTHLLGRMI